MNSNKYFRASSIFILLMLLSFLPNNIYTQTEDSLYYTNPDYHVAKELFNKRIVMLGDYGHNQPGPYHHVYNVLENWLQMCMQKPESIHLTYIIECDSPTVNELNKYIASGDIKSLINLIAPDFYLENLEYYAQLRNFALRLDSVNKYRKYKLSFTVKGFEEVGYTGFEIVAKMSQKEWELWFVNERDSNTAKGMIDYVKSNSNEQILIFYGGAHLINHLVNKNHINEQFRQTQILSDDEGLGYFLAYYLQKEFGKENVCIFEPFGQNLKQYINNSKFPDLGDKDFITKPNNLNLPDSLFSDADYICSVHDPYFTIIEGGSICSNFILKKTIQKVNRIKIWIPGYPANVNYQLSLHNIWFLTGMKFKSDTLLNDWIKNNNFNEMDWLYNNGLSDTLLAYMSRIPKDNIKDILLKSYLPLLSKYGISYWAVDTSKEYLESGKWKYKEFPNLMNQLKFTNSIGIYWIGYPKEKVKAKEYLIWYSGEDFQEPEKYLQWYRMKYFGVEY